MWLAGLLSACVRQPLPPDPGLPIDAIAAHVRQDVKDREGWATDVRSALLGAGEVPDEEHVCQVFAIIEQESGYAADPAVPGLGKIARAEMAEELKLLGPLADLG